MRHHGLTYGPEEEATDLPTTLGPARAYGLANECRCETNMSDQRGAPEQLIIVSARRFAMRVLMLRFGHTSLI
jgi:hypothetical protein